MSYFVFVLPEACEAKDVEVREVPEKVIPYEKWRTLPGFKDPDTTIGIVSFGKNWRHTVLLDDNGLVNDTNPKPTLFVNGHIICGPLAITTSTDDGDSIGFTADQVEKLLPMITDNLLGQYNLPTPEPYMEATPFDSFDDIANKTYVQGELNRLYNKNNWGDL